MDLEWGHLLGLGANTHHPIGYHFDGLYSQLFHGKPLYPIY